jgi:AraC-like DNA-binding protein
LLRNEIREVYLDCTELFLSCFGRSEAKTRNPHNNLGIRGDSESSSRRDDKVKPQELKKLQELLDCIAGRYKEKWKIDFTLSKMGMSKSRFCDFFRYNTGMSFVAYINKVRVGKAACLLLETNQTVEAIGYDCGFDSPSSFYKCFKSHYGMSPGEFRKMRSK